ncbi:hypothetical protein DFH28DRAFT_829385, partial [Melampsora americana]
QVLQPVIDMIAKLELSHTTVGEVWSKVIVMYMRLKEMRVDAQYSTFKSCCIQTINRQCKVFDKVFFL